MAVKTEAKRQSILKVATEVFQESGYERATISEICARVGGSKSTIYNYFKSKDELFYHVISNPVESEIDEILHTIDPCADDFLSSLRCFGEHYLSFTYSPYVRANRHLTISVSGRAELGRLAYEGIVLRAQTAVSESLKTAMALGKLRQTDPVVATHHLLSLLESELIDRFMLQILGEVSSKEIKAVTQRAIDVFMAAYGIQ